MARGGEEMSRESARGRCARVPLFVIWGVVGMMIAAAVPDTGLAAGPMLVAQANQSQASVEQALQAAVDARRAKDFDRAREILAGLERRVSQGSPDFWAVNDEVNFHLPLAVAQQAMNQGEIGLAESKIDEAARYLNNHPRRGEMTQTLERYRRALWMAK